MQKVKKAVRTRWLSLDAAVEVVYMFLHALRATPAEVLKKTDDMKFLAVLCFKTYVAIFINTE